MPSKKEQPQKRFELSLVNRDKAGRKHPERRRPELIVSSNGAYLAGRAENYGVMCYDDNGQEDD